MGLIWVKACALGSVIVKLTIDGDLPSSSDRISPGRRKFMHPAPDERDT